MNNDVCTEILLHMPMRSLLRFRAVCKFWCYIIDSPSFRKLHIDNNKSSDMLYIWFSNYHGRTLLGHNDKLLVSYTADDHKCSRFYRVNLYGPVKGLICIYSTKPNSVITLSNPCLGQVKHLPASSYSDSCFIIKQEVAVGFDEDYKVVQLMVCSHHHYRLHALLYTRKTDSRRELAVLNGGIQKLNSIKSKCENGHFAHWHVVPLEKSSYPELILSLDMKKEVFQTIRLSSFGPRHHDGILACTYFAEDLDEHSFWRFDLPHSSTNTVTIYRSSEVRYGVGRVLFWNLVFECWMNVFMYDYRARKYDYRPRKYDARKYDFRDNNAFSKYKHTCSFVSLENVSKLIFV